MIIAIDGPAAAGKGTLAVRLADRFNLALLDTGLLYRAVGRKVLDADADPEDATVAEGIAQALKPEDLAADGLRTDDTAQAASKVSAIPGVRAALLKFQRDFAHNPPDGKAGAVLDGRDIGTVVCPDADVKLFIVASAEVRAERRLKELLGRGEEAIYARVLEEMKERDARDMARSASPLESAKDAIQMDTSELDAEQVFTRAMEIITSKNQ